MLFGFDIAFIASASVMALVLDQLLGEPKRFHPLIGFAYWAQFWQKRLENKHNKPLHPLAQFVRGLICWLFAVSPWVVLSLLIVLIPWPWWFTWSVSVLLLYLAVGQKSLAEHAQAVYQPLVETADLTQARHALSMIVSRDTTTLNEQQITSATVETVLENTHDAVIGPLFWFCLLGVPGVVLFRLANTLDAMWGYKTSRYEFFGKTAARMDDVLGFMSARVTVLLFATRSPRAIRGAWFFGRKWYSPNAGPVMAAGAGVLNLKLGGSAPYAGKEKARPYLYDGREPKGTDIRRATRLMYWAAYSWAVLWVFGWISSWVSFEL